MTLLLPVVGIGMLVSWLLPLVPWIDLGRASWILKPIGHFLFFALLAGGLGVPLRRRRGGLLAAWLVAVCAGAADEWGQRLHPPRSASLSDFGFDALGATAAILFLRRIR